MADSERKNDTTNTTTPENGGEPPATLKYPKGAYFILFGYLLERFTYYGLFGAVVFYMQRVLQFSASTSSTLKAVMEGIIYLAPIAGAILADGYLGKVRTVFTMCCFYVAGAVVFSLSSISPIMISIEGTQAAGIGGILILGLAAGLMKAVYSSLGPDQFKLPEQRRQQQRFFYAFYWMINAGAFLGQFLTAQLRESVQCFGDDCYMLPFLILCGLMVLSTAVFYAGKPYYHEAPPDSMLIDSFKCIFYASKKSTTNRDKPVAHWLDRAGDKYDAELIKDVKKSLRVLLLFITFPFFWALFFQTSTGMIFQAKRLYDRVGTYRIPPELTSSVNALVILLLIPLFELIIYPFLDRRGILKSTTTRMFLGMTFGCLSFIVYGLVNLSVEQVILGSKQAQLNVYNVRECITVVSSDWLPQNIEILPGHEFKFEPVNLNDEEITHRMTFLCGAQSEETMVKLQEFHETTVVLFPTNVATLTPTKQYLKDKDAEAKVRFSTDPKEEEYLDSFNMRYGDLIEKMNVVESVSDFKTVSPQNYTIRTGNKTLGYADIRQDGVYDIVVSQGKSMTFNLTKPSTVHMGWLFPTYLIITTGEVLFSVSSLDFAYSEAPTSMKSVMQAVNLFTITVGLWMFAIFTKVTSLTGIFDHRASNEAFTYAVGMAINSVAFMLLSRDYENKKAEAREKEQEETERREEYGRYNPAYQEEDQM